MSVNEINAIDPGAFRHQITLQRPRADIEPLGTGEIDLTKDANWETVGQRMAARLERGGPEGWRLERLSSNVAVVYTLWLDSLTQTADSSWRVTDAGLIWDVESVEMELRLVRLNCRRHGT